MVLHLVVDPTDIEHAQNDGDQANAKQDAEAARKTGRAEGNGDKRKPKPAVPADVIKEEHGWKSSSTTGSSKGLQCSALSPEKSVGFASHRLGDGDGVAAAFVAGGEDDGDFVAGGVAGDA